MKNSIFNAVCKTRYLALLVVLILTCGNVWADTHTLGWGSASGSSGTYTNFTDKSGTVTDIVSFTTAKNSSSSNPAYNSSSKELRLYYASNGSGGSITLTPASGVTITGFTITTSTSPTTKYKVGNGSLNAITLSSNTGSVTGLSVGSSSSITIQNCNTTNTQLRIKTIQITYTASCEKIGAPTVTATPGDGRIDLSWSNQTGASSYSVTKTPAGGSVGTPSKSGSTWSCAITGLTNGTTYTWSVEAVGSGDYCASGNTAASASATPNVFRTITYYDKDGQHTTSLADGTNIATALTALYGGDDPVSCDATNYEYFVGWKVGEISGTASSVTLLDDEVVNASSPSNNYYAVWSDTDPSAGGSELFNFEGGVASDLTNMTGVTASGLGSSDYAASNAPYRIKLDGTGDYVIIAIASQPSKVTIGVKMIGGNSTSSITVQESTAADGTFTDVEALSISGDQNDVLALETSESFKATTRAVKLYFTKGSNVGLGPITIEGAAGDAEYITTCCADPELAYGTGSVTKTYGASAFTNTLTNSHSVAVTYAASNVTPAGCITVNSSTGAVTINGAGSATITASSAAQTKSGVSYCADEASYILTVNKASISPTLSYTPNSVTVGGNTSAPTVGGNPGSGGVTYAITSATPAGCATINASTGVVTGEAVGSVTVTATVAATTNYNGGSATANVTITAASYFPNGKTIFIQAHSTSAWTGGGCVKAWFHTAGGSEGAQSTYWLFDAAGGGDDGKKLFATVVPATGDLPYLDIQRFAANCSDWWNKNGGCSYSDAAGSNTIRSTGKNDDASDGDYIRWNASSVELSLYGDPNSWGSSMGTFADQGNGVWTATYENYAPANAAGESQEFKISTNYNGWIGNTGSNNNATLDGMHVGSTYNITATLDVTTHALTMSKTFVKGTVHFDLQGHGSAIADLTNVAAGTKISVPSPAPNETGWDFGGWYKEAGCTNAWNFASDEVTETMTLYAKWTKKSYTITSTLNNVTSSPAIPTSYEYTGSAAGLSYTISADAGYRLPTTITVTGTTYTWNPTTGALVLTGTITGNVSVTISGVQTHTVDWYVGGSAPANKIGDDGQTTVVDHGGKIEDFPATTPDGSACEKTFVGWTNTTSYVHGTSPLFNDVAGSPTINADASFYAVFAEVSGSGDFELVTSVTQLSAGDEVTIASVAGNSQNGAVIKAYNNGNNWPEASVTTSATGTIAANTTDMQTFTLEAGTETNSWAFNDGTGYPYAASSNSNHMKREAAKSANSSFSITIDGSTSVATIVAQGNYTRNVMQYNSSSNLFACYGSASQASVYLYKKPSYTGHTITCSDCGTSVTPTFTAAPAGGTVVVTKGGAAVTSGSTVKTCSQQTLTVTVTPAEHYRLTAMSISGVTGITTSPAILTDGLPTTEEKEYTITIPQDATGTLTITPTIAELPKKNVVFRSNGSAIAGDAYNAQELYIGSAPTMPAAVASSVACNTTHKTFVGWSLENWSGEISQSQYEAKTVYAAANAGKTLEENDAATVTYHAVWATGVPETTYEKLASDEFSTTDTYVIAAEKSSTMYYFNSCTNTDSNNSWGKCTTNPGNNTPIYFTLSGTAEALVATTTETEARYLKGLTANNFQLSSSSQTVKLHSDGTIYEATGNSYYLQYNHNSGSGGLRWYNSSANDRPAAYFYRVVVNDDVTYLTTCCPTNVELESVVSGEGTVTFSKSVVPTCEANATATMTITPSEHYYLSAFNTTGSTATPSTTLPAVTTPSDAEQTTTLTFAADAYGTYTANATFSPILVSSLTLHAVKKDNSSTVIEEYTSNNITLNLYPTEGKTASPADPLGHTLKVEFGAFAPANALNTNYTWSATVNGEAQAFDGNALSTNSVIEFNKSTGKLVAKAAGTAELIITANDGSGVTAKVTITVANVSLNSVSLSPDEVTVYSGQKAFVNVGYNPVNVTTKGYNITGQTNATAPNKGNDSFSVKGGNVTETKNETWTITTTDGSKTATLAVTVKPLPKVHFEDIVHGVISTDVTANVDAEDETVIQKVKSTPTHDDVAASGNTCEQNHLHLIGWIDSDWSGVADYINNTIDTKPTTAELEAAGAGVWIPAGNSIDLEAKDGKTYYAVWGKEDE